MIELENYITIDKEVINSPNLCNRFSDADLDAIGIRVYEGYEADEGSRAAWKSRTEAAMDLALQIQKDKSFPWPNCSNVSFPLITVATLQFHARAYPAIIQGTDIVKYRVVGDDPQGVETKRANRIGEFMSYQVLEEDQAWEEQHDKLFINLAVVGTNFVKTTYNSAKSHNVSDLVMARDLVLNYWAKSVDDCNRKTQIYPLSRNDVYERALRGTFRDILDEDWYKQGYVTPSHDKTAENNRQGVQPPQPDDATSLIMLEQHCSMDLDGDGYAEPYIITIEATSKKVMRIVTRFDREEDIFRVESGKRKGQIISISPMEYFTKYGFIPSPDGGIYDIGLGTLTGPLNESVNSLVNQLLDAGSMSNGGGGFLGRGAKIRGGAYTFSPFEWKRVDSTGDDLNKSIVPLQVREPSGVLLNLLSLIINYTNRISGSTDMMAGENPGQNTPAETSRSMIEQGSKIYNAIFKRIWRSMKEEFRKLYILNSIYLPIEKRFGSSGSSALKEDFLGSPSSIVPVADPHITSEGQQIQQAITLKQAAAQTPGYNVELVERRFLKAMRIDDAEALYPGMQKFPPPQDPKMQIAQLNYKCKELGFKSDQMMFMAELQEQSRLNNAVIMELQAKAALDLAKVGSERASTDLMQFSAVIDLLNKQETAIQGRMKLLQEGIKNEQSTTSGGVSGVEAAPSDLGATGGLEGMAGALEGPIGGGGGDEGGGL